MMDGIVPKKEAKPWTWKRQGLGILGIRTVALLAGNFRSNPPSTTLIVTIPESLE
jgi:hypothetical protein